MFSTADSHEIFIYNTFALYNCTQFSKNYGKSFFRIEESGLTH